MELGVLPESKCLKGAALEGEGFSRNQRQRLKTLPDARVPANLCSPVDITPPAPGPHAGRLHTGPLPAEKGPGPPGLRPRSAPHPQTCAVSSSGETE